MRPLARVVLLRWALGLSAAAVPASPADALAGEQRAEQGRPKVVLDRLTLPAGEGDARYRRHLERVLRREVRRADWGVGRGHRIEYRFTIDKLEMRVEGDVLHVRCEAIGRLPKGKSARSKLSFGGEAKSRRQVIERVMEIVARGVITRLAELERRRRGDD